jgi:hypothetical protein
VELLARMRAGRLEYDLHGLPGLVFADVPMDPLTLALPLLFAMQWRMMQAAQREAASLDPSDTRAVTAFLLRWFGSQDRPHVLATLAEMLPIEGEAFWRVAVDEWGSFDAIPHARYAALFARNAACRPVRMIGAAEQAFLDDLPDPVTLYRGQSERDQLGLSWTTDVASAERFAKGHRGIPVPRPAVFTVTLPKHAIAFCCVERGEAEVVLMELPPRRRARRLRKVRDGTPAPRR